ncbi:MAG: tetratricopeptide repeat protein [Planctomycetota bacterium]|jgi:tetratricopeptide (TPR) repeat protein|nr:tetratricopeptide repeat protein [Planctomycetota bacterium]
MQALAYGLMAVVVVLGAGCARTETAFVTRVSTPTLETGAVRLGVIQAEAGLEPQLRAIALQVMKAQGLEISDETPAADLDITLTCWAIDAEPSTLVHERWASDGGASRMVQDRMAAERAVFALQVRLADAGMVGQVLDHETVVYGLERVPRGGQIRLRFSQSTVPVVAARGQALLDAVARRGFKQIFADLRGSEPERIPLVSGDSTQRKAIAAAVRGNLQEAQDLFEILLKETVNNDATAADLHYNAAAVYDAQGSYVQALKHYGLALALDPRDDWAAQRDACALRLGG